LDKDIFMARLSPTPPNFADCLTIGEAAEVLGVSAATLRNWDRSGKLKPRRHPQNGYRIYLHEDLDAVLRSAELAKQIDESNSSQIDWSKAGEGDHYVQFYESNEFYIDTVSGFIAAALGRGNIGVMVATSEHRRDVSRKLESLGIDITAAERDGHLFLRDAEAIISQIMVDGELVRARFANMVEGVIGNLAASGRHIFATGEIAGLLWSMGKRAAAVEVEQFWDDFAKRNRMTILCAYPIGEHSVSNIQALLAEVCNCHSRVFPAESYPISNDEKARHHSITLLQHKANALNAEILHRHEVEARLRDEGRRRVEHLAAISNELHSQLTCIRSAVELLEGNLIDESSRTAAKGTIRRQIDQLTSLAEGLAGLSSRGNDIVES
jgi:hypothetical protein